MAQENNPLESISSRITGTAHNLARRYGANPEDVEQDLIVLLLEEYTQNPDFLNDPVAAVNYAANRVGWMHRKEMLHAARFFIGDRQMTDDPDDRTLVEVYSGCSNPWPQVERELVIEQKMAEMDERDRLICEMLAEGYTAREIGPEIGCSYRTVYNRMDAMAGTL